ncbi:MFS general substrate transporter [Pyrrhoderma noxium]|uniref:MFS general substrate transporter n=1 Tax=Pyrrhoderma noxium TaxID=2282107 RepID=A0A286UEF0_9AGAM|nr:MFS general substrate transporter [Pyrrhoderma noxium]
MTGFGSLSVSESAENGDVRWAGRSRIMGPKWMQMPLLTIGLLGVQVLWSAEMSYASPYLISLGLSKSYTAVAFLAGPLSGLVVQPLIGVIADNSKSRFGRRRPYMLLATAICIVSMLLLGFTRDFVSIFISRESSSNKLFTILLAVVALYGIDFSINAVQAVDRALIVDTIPASHQPDANAWAARMLGIGSVVGFFIGNADLTHGFPWFGSTQMEILSVLAAFLLLSTQLTTAATVKEKILVSSSGAKKGLRQEIREIWDNILTLPRIIRQICIVQFLAWLAWFPVLFYTTVYIGDLYKSGLPIPANEEEATIQDDQATITGSRAFFHFALIALTANWFLPFLVKKEGGTGEASQLRRSSSLIDKLRVIHLCDLWAMSHLLFAICMFMTFFVSTVSGASFLITIVGFSWAVTQWAPFALLAEEIIASSQDDTFDDNGSISIRLLDVRHSHSAAEPSSAEPDVLWDEGDERERLMNESKSKVREGNDQEVDSRSSSFEDTRLTNGGNGLLGNGLARQSQADLPAVSSPNVNSPDVEGEHTLPLRSGGGGLQAKSGIIIGIHNLFIVIPQFISTAITSIVFALFDSERTVATDNVDVEDTAAILFSREGNGNIHGVSSVAIVFRLGGIAAMLAFVLCWRLARELKRAR